MGVTPQSLRPQADPAWESRQTRPGLLLLPQCCQGADLPDSVFLFFFFIRLTKLTERALTRRIWGEALSASAEESGVTRVVNPPGYMLRGRTEAPVNEGGGTWASVPAATRW